MAYLRQGLGGVQSRPRGRPVARAAATLGAVDKGAMASAAKLHTRGVGMFAKAAVRGARGGGRQGMQGVSLGADDTGELADLTVPTLDDGTASFQRDILASTRAIQAHERERIRKEEIRGWVQIAATLSIPLAAAIWRAIGIGRKKREAASSTP